MMEKREKKTIRSINLCKAAEIVLIKTLDTFMWYVCASARAPHIDSIRFKNKKSRQNEKQQLSIARAKKRDKFIH